ncbi:MAG TPA: sulfatase-like hydrolase/transferase, partial [Polyangiaceae bacterium]|nr:sulfatase-like hydrolase/transferase [Polyangiaceae bacterium]
DLVEVLPQCDLEHRGVLLDAGTPALIGRYGWLDGLPPGTSDVEHDGSTWTRVAEKKLTFSFLLHEPTPIFVAARTYGLGARSASVALDDQPLGTLSFHRGQIRVASTGTTTLAADPGLHSITLRFAGRARGDEAAYADLDWIRIGIPDESPATYGAPTLRDVILPAAALSGVPHRSIALRAPGAARCAFHLPEGARLRTAIGLLGPGEGDAEIRALRDGKKPEVLKSVHLTGSDKAVWTDVDLPLKSVAGSLMALELRAVSAPPGGRVLFGDPVLVIPAPPPSPVPPAKAVVIVALSGVERSLLPPWSGGPSQAFPTLSDLALTATTFNRHRAPGTIVQSVMASLLTGLQPRAHALTDAGARLPASQTTLGAVARDASVRSAMFTGVPASFKAFGFGGAWERFVEHAPNSGDPATAPIDSAASWIAEVLRAAPDARLLAVVHARGAHPPWHVTPRELEDVPPPDYAGPIEPRRAAQVLAQLRKRRAGAALSPTDRDRVRALSTIALAGQDKALGALVAALKTAGAWDSTLLIVTGEVSSGPSEATLFAEGLDLRESVLTLPLYVHFPGGAHAGAAVSEPTEIVDIARTALSALGISFARRSFGRDLALVAAGVSGFGGPQIATLDDRYSTRWGDLVLSGRFGSSPQLCDLGVDPICSFNRRDGMPIATQALFRRMVATDLATRAPPRTREPATIDPETAASLNVWGSME